MSPEPKTRVVIIDDNFINNDICRIVIQMVSPESDIRAFADADLGLAFIKWEYSQPAEIPTVLLLDINMPGMSGWDFLNKFDELSVTIKRQIRIYVLSSSYDPKAAQWANENANVAGFIVKPLTDALIRSIFGELEPIHEERRRK